MDDEVPYFHSNAEIYSSRALWIIKLYGCILVRCVSKYNLGDWKHLKPPESDRHQWCFLEHVYPSHVMNWNFYSLNACLKLNCVFIPSYYCGSHVDCKHIRLIVSDMIQYSYCIVTYRNVYHVSVQYTVVSDDMIHIGSV